jgi:endonuclease G, mitochondrial
MKAFYKALFILFVTSMLFSCRGGSIESDKEEVTLNLTLQNAEVAKSSGYMFVDVAAGGEWTLELSFEEGVEPWAELSQTSGKGSKKGIVLSYESYTGREARALTFILSSGGKTCSAELRQGGVKSSAMYATAQAHWMELPETKEDDGLEWGKVTMLSSKNETIRNYSYYYDYDNLVSHWVAYPLNSSLMGSGSRTNAWGVLDPNLPSSQQAVLARAYNRGYDRGHQIPSADRLSEDANPKTFYGTNMTPQIGQGFNQDIWANLENKVRGWARSCDTLYVVTGCVVNENSTTSGGEFKVGGYVYDNNGKKVAVPTAYYKAALRYTKSSSTYGYSGYCGAAIYLEHKTYSNSNVYQSDLISVDALEEKIGIDLFVNLPSAIGESQAAKVEAQDPTKVACWK